MKTMNAKDWLKNEANKPGATTTKPEDRKDDRRK